jgi:HAD superfamily hydrolase (TIGR01549 family)
MNGPKLKLLVLDVHGVVLTNPLQDFLDYLAASTGQSPARVRRRWRERLRTPAWTGQIADEQLWEQLTGGDTTRNWRAILEAMYERGTAVPHLCRWSRQVPLWLLSNHRSHWLLPRLERFGLAQVFQRVVVSDVIGTAKPDPAAYQHVIERVPSPASCLFVDDRLRNIASAADLGLKVVHASPDVPWISAIDDALQQNNAVLSATSYPSR